MPSGHFLMKIKSKRRNLFSLHFILPNIVLLVLVALAVETTYTFYVRPHAADLMLKRKYEREIQNMSGEGEIQSQPLLLIIKDHEPETEIIFFLWGTLFLLHRMVIVHREQRLLEIDFVHLSPGERILPEAALERFVELRDSVAANPGWKDRVLPNCILVALQRFHATGSVHEALAAVKDRSERAADELDSSLSLVRYIAWAIPAIGFVGTARGIGDALTFADAAVKGDISAVTSWLGLAFNSTLVGLLLCLPLMYALHVVQSSQETAILDIQSYCCDEVLEAMKVPASVDQRRDLPDPLGRSPLWSP